MRDKRRTTDRLRRVRRRAQSKPRTERARVPITARAGTVHRGNQRYELERRHMPAGIELIELPRPHDEREIYDFSGGEELIETAYRMTLAALDVYERSERAVHTAHRRPHLPFRRARAVEA